MATKEHDTTEPRWFKITVFIVSGFFAAFSIANLIYYDRIKKNGGCGSVTQGEATAMFWINLILAIVTLIVFLWALWRIIFSREYRQHMVDQGMTYVSGEGTGLFNPLEGPPAFDPLNSESSLAASRVGVRPVDRIEVEAGQRSYA